MKLITTGTPSVTFADALAQEWAGSARVMERLRELVSEVVRAESYRSALRALVRELNESVGSEAEWQVAETLNAAAAGINFSSPASFTLHTWRPAAAVAARFDGRGVSVWGSEMPPGMRPNRLSVAVSSTIYEIADLAAALQSVAHVTIAKPSWPANRLLAHRVSRLRQALLRFVVGFFGSHKLDGRNNP